MLSKNEDISKKVGSENFQYKGCLDKKGGEKINKLQSQGYFTRELGWLKMLHVHKYLFSDWCSKL